jgi:hypothetical protein
MRYFSTIIYALCPVTNRLIKYEGQIIKAISKQDAFDYCQSNGLGYLHISDEVCSEYQSTKGRYFNEKIDYYQIQFN